MNGCERLKSMIEEGSFQKPLFKIYMYLKTREDMYEKYLNSEKTMEQMYEYIKNQVKESATNGVAMVEDSVVYGLAVHYFDESNEKLGIKKKEVKKKIKEVVENIYPKTETTEKEERKQCSLFEGDF